MKAYAYAKVNLGLQVSAAGPDGIHPLRGLFQTVDWRDEITVEDAEEDSIEVPDGGAPEDETNLAWQAIVAARRIGLTDLTTCAGSPLTSARMCRSLSLGERQS